MNITESYKRRLSQLSGIQENFIINSEPLESSMKLRKRLEKIIKLLSEFESEIIREIDDISDDYSSKIKNMSMKINHNNNLLEDIEISLDDLIHFKKNKV